MDGKNFLLVLIALLALTVLGYYGFLFFATGKELPQTYGLFAFAVIAAVATFFSPCSFGLLPSYLSLYVESARKKSKSFISSGIIVALGMFVFSILLGMLIALIGGGFGKAFSVSEAGELSNFTRGFRIIIGFVLLFFGIASLTKIKIVSKFFHKISRSSEAFSQKGLFFYGFSYNIANIGCAGPIMAGLLILATASGFEAAIIAFLIYAITMSLLMFLVSIMVSTAKKDFIEKTVSYSAKIQKISAIMLIIVGVFIVYTALFPNVFVELFFPR